MGEREARQQEVWEVVEAINRAWQSGQLDDIDDLLHPDLVTVLPGFQGRVEGSGATLESYREFSRDAVVHEFRSDDVQVHVTGDTAVVTYAFTIDYEYQGQELREEGHEVQVLVRDGSSWRSTWRMILPHEAS